MMGKREFVMLCHKYKPGTHVNGYYVSDKLDGIRAFWDGGISRGRLALEIPWSNTEKDWRMKSEVVATGLWSRMGNVIRAPEWWLDNLPQIPLDGELWTGIGGHQQLSRIVKTHSGTDWSPVRYMVFDSPPLESIFADGVIDVRMGKVLYKVRIRGAIQWIKNNYSEIETVRPGAGFEDVYEWLKKREWNDTVCLHEQTALPYNTKETERLLREKLDKIVEAGGEGLVLRAPMVGWKPERVHSCLKVKPIDDSEGVVVGSKWGRQTDHGSKLLGKMGALTVLWNGVRFDISGFTEEEREMEGPDIMQEGTRREGEIVTGLYRSKHFPIGSSVTFQYRDLTEDGKPKEARYFRKRGIE
jgi:DNA ligase-1